MSEPGAATAAGTVGTVGAAGAPRRASLWVTGLHTGGCSACAQSLAALEAPRYAKRLAALGVSFIRSPRQSDVILLCGALTEQARVSVSRVLEGTPRPRALVAVGDCAINGCVFAGSPSLITPLAQTLNVNVEIGGCPPTPEAIIAAVGEAGRLLSAGVGAVAGEPVAPTILPPTPSAPSVPLTAGDRAARLAALIEAASGGWGDDDEDVADDLADDETRGRMPEHMATETNEIAETTTPTEYLPGNGASAPRAGQQKQQKQREEKRR